MDAGDAWRRLDELLDLLAGDRAALREASEAIVVKLGPRMTSR